MRTIYKFHLDVRRPSTWRISVGGEPAVVAVRAGDEPEGFLVWVEHEPAGPETDLSLFVVGTGQPIPTIARHVGVSFSDPFVWHLYALEG